MCKLQESLNLQDLSKSQVTVVTIKEVKSILEPKLLQFIAQVKQLTSQVHAKF